ncbi:hypothetical protein C8F04DRAFT_1255835 [Mycena alexandri]|uniref:F-box domain-containing protein n=1 Tax=Mycena alexandri TaxID=1745969 RepID=A0AAD6X6M0_9AGAR|nr:hypothetical protein C8F04DRAFT_1255835 [Mycena alexandri]
MLTREAVCCLSRHWRAIGLADGVLWSHVFVSPRLERSDILRCSGRCSSDLDVYVELLDMTLDPSFLPWFTVHVAPLLLRCREISIVSPYTSPSMDLFRTLSTLDGTSLQSVYLDFRPVALHEQWMNSPIPPPFRGLLPQLRLFSMRRNFLLPSTTPFFQSLQELHLCSLRHPYMPTMETMLDIFRSTPSLVRLRLRDVECSGWRTSSLPLPILANLTHLAIINLTVGVIDLLSFVSMPSLHTFHLEYRHDNAMEYMQIAWVDIFLGVTTAIVRTESWDHDMFARVLCRFKAAIRIDLRKNDHLISGAFHHLVLTWEGYLVNAEIVLLPSWLPLVTAADLLTNPRRRSGSARLHLITPSSLFDLTTSVEYYLSADGTVRSRPVFGPVDFWV